MNEMHDQFYSSENLSKTKKGYGLLSRVASLPTVGLKRLTTVSAGCFWIKFWSGWALTRDGAGGFGSVTETRNWQCS